MKKIKTRLFGSPLSGYSLEFPPYCVYCGKPQEVAHWIRKTSAERIVASHGWSSSIRYVKTKFCIPLCKAHEKETRRNKALLNLGMAIGAIIPIAIVILSLVVLNSFSFINTSDPVVFQRHQNLLNGIGAVLLVLLIILPVIGIFIGGKYSKRIFSRYYQSMTDTFPGLGVLGLRIIYVPGISLTDIELYFTNEEMGLLFEHPNSKNIDTASVKSTVLN